MEDDLELRRYIRAVLRRGWLIGVLALAAALAGFGYASLRSSSYQATALLVVSRPLFAIDLESVAQNLQVPVKTFGDLAMSDEVLQTLHDRLQAAGAEPLEPELLRKQLSATAAADTGLLRLNVADKSSAKAAQIANLWADIILEQGQALYGPDSPQMVSYTEQLDAARATLAAADSARAAFQNQNLVGILSSRLGNLRNQFEAALDRQNRFALMADDVSSLLARLNTQDNSAPASTADEAALLVMVADATNTGLPAPATRTGTIQPEDGTNVDIIQESPQPLQLQINITGGASTHTVRSLKQAVQVFSDGLATRIADADALAEALLPQILQAQADLAEANRLAAKYSSDVELAENQYKALAGQVSQARIAAQDAAGLVRVASLASVPTEIARTGRLVTAVIGALIGVILGVLLAVALEWWRTPLAGPRATPEAALTAKTL